MDKSKLRDEFAIAVLPIIIEKSGAITINPSSGLMNPSPGIISMMCYQIADAMLEEREKK